jgi:hypothetical protein
MIVRNYIFALALVGTTLPGNPQSSPAPRESNDIAVVVNVANPVDDLSPSELRRILLGERRFWKGNVQVKLVLRDRGTRERDLVLSILLRMSNREFVEHWRAKIFRGEAGEGPLSVDSISSACQYVRERPSAVTFMAARDVPATLKILKLDGKLPGALGYALK